MTVFRSLNNKTSISAAGPSSWSILHTLRGASRRCHNLAPTVRPSDWGFERKGDFSLIVDLDRTDCDRYSSIIGVLLGRSLFVSYEAPRMTDSRSDATLRTVTVGVLLLAGGLAINYLLERRNIFAIWERSAYPVSWVDVFLSAVVCFSGPDGHCLGRGRIMERTTVRQLRRYTMRIAIPLTILYALFSFGMQFIATGADQIGECAGLNQAASSSNVIPESKRRRPPRCRLRSRETRYISVHLQRCLGLRRNGHGSAATCFGRISRTFSASA